jgi:hypothetical protein
MLDRASTSLSNLARNWPCTDTNIVVLRSMVISRNCSQNSGSALIEVSRPLSLTLCTYCFMSGIRVAQCLGNANFAGAEITIRGHVEPVLLNGGQTVKTSHCLGDDVGP